MAEIVGEYVDRIVNIEMRFASGLPRGVTHRLYDAARTAQGGDPMTLRAARALLERVRRGDVVFFVTGAGSAPGLPYGETDGPLGAAALARALGVGLGARPVVVCEERTLGPIQAAFNAAGYTVMREDWWAARSGYCSTARTFPGGLTADGAFCQEVVDHFRPSAIVFVEKAGPNAQGVFHSIMGVGRGSDVIGNAHLLAPLARERGVLTVGIGDGGNEIGFGVIREAVREIQPYGRRCQCPCGGGVATVTATDVLVAAGVSNWGGYGVAAMLALLLQNQAVLHDEETESLMLQDCVRSGGMDGAYAAQVPAVDGIGSRVHIGMITMLHQMIRNGLTGHKRDF